MFASQGTLGHLEKLDEWTDALAQELSESNAVEQRVRIDWHLSDRDFLPETSGRLTRMARSALDGAPLCFVFDRARRPVLLAEGVDRQHPVVLLTVGVHLPRLADQPGVGDDPTLFLKKLGSLARLALSAAVQKREYLRRQERASGGPSITGGFLLDRARLVVAPVGLEAVVQRLTGHGLTSGGLDFGKQIVQTLRDVLRHDGGLTRLATCLDGPADFRLEGDWPTAEQVAGLTAWDATAPLKNQLRSARALQGVAEGGTTAVFLPDDPRPTPESTADLLRQAWKQADVMRVRLFRAAQGV